MTTVAYLDLFSGASGDMLLGALVDAGLSVERLRAALSQLGLTGYALETQREVRHGISGTRLCVRDLAEDQPARHLAEIRALIERSALSERVRNTSIAVFERLARAEAHVHGISIDEVHFHEIGAVDSLVDIVGFVLGLELLGVEKVYASAVPLGSGTVETAHGLLPVPAPATAVLLAEVRAPTRPHPAQTEILTPTAAALLAELATFAYPPLHLAAVGYGFGQKEFPWPNAVRVFLGEIEQEMIPEDDHVIVLECNLDNMPGEMLGFAQMRLFEAGALDVWFTPIQMKKNRPGVMLSVLARPEQTETLARLVLRETTTLGLRVSPLLRRVTAERRSRQAQTPWGPVWVKEKWLNGMRVSAAPEYEDCARVAREHNVPLARVYETALLAVSADQPSNE